MAVDWLLAWGVAKTAGLIFKPVLEDFAKDASKDVAKDYVKNCFKNVFSSLRKEPLQRALGCALRELLQLMQDELLDCGLRKDELEEWIEDVKCFTKSEEVQEAIYLAFNDSETTIDPSLIAQGCLILKTQENFRMSFPGNAFQIVLLAM